jgi:ribulose 1,5-bisphosphate synthetase/thiazole synthase
MTKRYDVIVVGAGPAGLMVAKIILNSWIIWQHYLRNLLHIL